MRVAVVGATGLLGRRLVSALAARGDRALALSRGGGAVPGGEPLRWDPAREPFPARAREDVDAIVNLAGAPLAGRRWTASRRRAIRDSRVETTRRIVEGLAAGGPRVLVNASAVGYYGARGDEEVDESTPPGDDFLARTCVAWEAAALGAERFGARVVLVRTGIVLAPEGGALPRLVTPARLGLGGPLGGGRQWWPWIHVEDEVGLFLLALDDERLRGPLVASAPNPARQRDLAAALGRTLGRPACLPAPAAALRLVFGEAAIVVLEGQRAVPRAALGAGYVFRFTQVEPALRALLSPPGGTSA